MRKRSAGDLIGGKFRLEKHLQCGGMGEVWAACNLQLDAPVALKLMSAHALASADLVARFEREAKAAARLRHANVVTIHEHGVFEDVPFIAMELLEGQDLSARLRQRGRLTHAEAWPIVSAICKALRRAHEMSIVHRDLKPANVFLARQDDDEIIKVLDFGIAKILDGVRGAVSTKAGTILGSVTYMAPEQAGDGVTKVDGRADLWSLGALTFRMLTGKVPFEGKSELEVILRLRSQPPPRASSIAPDLAPGADAFFARALARRPEDRFQSAMELAEAFASLGAAGPALPRSERPGEGPVERASAPAARVPSACAQAVILPAAEHAPERPAPRSPVEGAGRPPAQAARYPTAPGTPHAAPSTAPLPAPDTACPRSRAQACHFILNTVSSRTPAATPRGARTHLARPQDACTARSPAPGRTAPPSPAAAGRLDTTRTWRRLRGVPRHQASVIVAGALLAAVIAVVVVGWALLSSAAAP